MALQFNPSLYPVLDPGQYQENRPDVTRDVTNPIMQGLQMMLQQKQLADDQQRQNRLLEMQEQEQRFQYGSDAPVSRASFNPTTGQASPILNKATIGVSSAPSMIERFQAWKKQKGSPNDSVRQFAGLPEGYTPGQKHRDAFNADRMNELDWQAKQADIDKQKAMTDWYNRRQSGTTQVPGATKPVPGYNTPKQLESARVLTINEGAAVSRKLPDIEKVIDQAGDVFGPIGGRVRSLNPYDTKAQSIDSEMRSASQMFGRFMEGGVLRKEDEEKYRRMFPQLGDTKDVAKAKLQNVSRLLALKYNSDLDALKNSMYDVSGFQSLPVPESLADRMGAVEGELTAGHEEEGMRFLGGDPSDQNNWEPI